MKSYFQKSNRQKWAWLLIIVMIIGLVIPTSLMSAKADVARPVIQKSSGWLESAYVEWKPVSGASGYSVYVKTAGAQDSEYTRIDQELIREYRDASGKLYYRADAVGLSAGNYVLKVVPSVNKQEKNASKAVTDQLQVIAYDRTGFAWTDGVANGAYREDGQLKENAVILYISEDTKNSVSLDVVTGSGKVTKATGIQNILTAYKKGYDSRPLDIRMIGKVTDPSTLMGGDLLIDTKNTANGITLEGIGEDATAYGWGVKVKNSSNIEIRNIGVMDTNSTEGDDVGVQAVDHVWVHNCDLFYGEPGKDADQVKGDGAMDCKKSSYITFSYNHFWDCGKCNLLGLKEDTSKKEYITYHHNWYDHSDSRHPRVRTFSAHIYNNYYDGNAKYGAGACLGASLFMENNYFRNCKYPMMISMQGTDVIADWSTMVRDEKNRPTFSKENGGMIKSYGNYMEGQSSFVTYQQNQQEFDAYQVSSATDKVPSNVKSVKGGNTYDNFDTSSVMYQYTADSPQVAKVNVEKYAGRVNGGDFQWEFDDNIQMIPQMM